MQASLSVLFSMWPISGIRTRKMEKYSTDATWPMITKGWVTGIPPIHVRINTSAINVQNRNCVKGRNVRLRCLDV